MAWGGQELMIQQLLHFFYINKYVIELILACSMFTLVLSKRRGTVPRLLIFLILIFSISSLWSVELSQLFWLRIARYLLFGSIMFGGILFIFDATPYTALYVTVAGIAIQHIAVQVNNMIATAVNLSAYGQETMILYLFVTIPIYILFFFLFVRKVRNSGNIQIANRNILHISAGIIFLVLVLSHFFGLFSSDTSLLIYMVCSCYDVIGGLFSLTLLYFSTRSDKLEDDIILLQQFMEQEKKRMELSQENLELVNIKCHDIKKQLATLRGRVEESEIKRLEDIVEIYDSSYQTGCEVLDMILAEKSLLCKKLEITLTCMATVSRLSLSSSEIYSIFANLLDNAITAVNQLQEPEKRIIDLTVREDKGFLIIHIENYYTGELKLENGCPITTKADSQFHGFGFKSVIYTVQQNKGTYILNTDDSIFSLNILIPL